MTGWLIYRKKDVEKNKGYIDFYFEEGKKLGINIKLILVDALSFGMENNELFIKYMADKISLPNFAINRSIYPLLSKQLEDMGVKVFNNSKLAEICNDKAKTYQYVSRLKIPIVDSMFLEWKKVNEAMENLSQPVVIKSVSGHGGSQVFLYDPKNDKETQTVNILSLLDKTDVVIQPLVGNRNQDLRVYVIGKNIIGSVLRTAKSGFKSNYSLGGRVESYHLSQDETGQINKIIDIFDFGLVGIDFLLDDDGNLVFNEIEDVVGARMLYTCTDINLVKLYLEYILSLI